MKTTLRHSRWPLVAATLFVIGAYAAPGALGEDAARPVVFRTQTMGTWASLTLMAADSAAVAPIAYHALTALHHVDSLMSNWTDISEVARINREAGQHEVIVHHEVGQVIHFAQRVSAATGGAFDITVEPLVRLWGFLGGGPHVPAQEEIDAVLDCIGHDKIRFNPDSGQLRFTRSDLKIDLGGIAKGYGVDRVRDLIAKTHTSDALIDLSGNMVAIGNGVTGDGWVVGVRDPEGTHNFVARLRLHDESVATSGDYEQFVSSDGRRYGHILDPRTGWSARGLSSVTVVAKHAMLCDAWATALFVLGPEAARQLAVERDDFAVVLIEPQDSAPHIIWVEDELKPHFQIKSGLENSHTVRYF